MLGGRHNKTFGVQGPESEVFCLYFPGFPCLKQGHGLPGKHDGRLLSVSATWCGPNALTQDSR